MQTQQLAPAAHTLTENGSKRLSVSLASTSKEVEEAQRLRWLVFRNEMGANLAGEDGVDRDVFDGFCDHLIVRDLGNNMVVGTYRILSPEKAAQIGRYYSESEFDLSRLHHLRSRTVEVGRSCVHPEYRTGGAINHLWSGIARYMDSRGYDYLIGCASIPMTDGGHAAASIFAGLASQNLSPLEYRVTPYCRFPLEELTVQASHDMPPLIKGYTRLGAWVCGEPAWDRDFNTADLLMLLPLSRIQPRYLKWLFGR